MPTIHSNTLVTLKGEALAHLQYPPPQEVQLVVAIEDAALKAPSSPLTTIIGVIKGQIDWVGSVDESMVTIEEGEHAKARNNLAKILMRPNSRCFEIIRLGQLRKNGLVVKDTIYQKDRPCVVIGETNNGSLLAVPLNDAGGGVQGHYQHAIFAADLDFLDSKDSIVELAHIWSFPATLTPVGRVQANAHLQLKSAVKKYYPGRKYRPRK